MIYEGQAISVALVEAAGGPIAELKFDNQKESVNKFDRVTVEELRDAVAAITADGTAKGLLVTSAKRDFIVGADITEFGETFKAGEEGILAWMAAANAIFNSVEDLPMPSVSAVNGMALGGGFEMALSTDYRIGGAKTVLGFPEVKLGIIPGFGGTVRAPRLMGADNAIEWISGGGNNKADAALKMGALDGVVAAGEERAGAIKFLEKVIAGRFDYKARRAQKTGPLTLPPLEQMMVFETAKGFIAGKAGKHYPAPVAAVSAMQKAASKGRDDALKAEHKAFVKVALTPVAQSLIGLFLNDQLIKKKSKDMTKGGAEIKLAAVLGAGIMGGGIAYQSASKGTPIVMKDINNPALDLGMSEANKLLTKQVSRKKLTPAKMGEILADIRPTLSYGDFGEVDIVVEAVVENPKVKKMVLADLEDQVTEDTILTSNTSTISIDTLAADLKRPENFCGMHFFNPVHRMPLVEVIRGAKSSDKAIAATVAYAQKMGKTPIVVNNCPGFLVNRILFPYFGGFQMLLEEGGNYQQIDKIMEGFGWPMGPAYLMDVVGMDTAHHAGEVMAEGFPDRMTPPAGTSLDILVKAGRYGQKTDKGFYLYPLDRKGRQKKTVDPETADMLKPFTGEVKEYDEQEIIERHMIPMIIETARCLEEGIVETPNEADMGLILGIGFPPFRGGALKYADSLGLAAVCEMADKYARLGKLYEPTKRMREMAANGETYYKG